MRTMKFLLASLLLGIVSACGFAPWSLWPLTLLAFAALLWLIGEAPSLRSALARGYWVGVGQFTELLVGAQRSMITGSL